MRRSTKGAWVMAGLAVLGAMMAGGGEARAAVTGIAIGGGFKPGTGDPPYDYIFQVYLNPDSSLVSPFNPLNPGLASNPDSFTIDNLVGVTSVSLTSQPENLPSVVFIPSITQTLTTYPYASDVTWSFYGLTTITNNTSSPELLGQFEVETSVNFATGPPVQAGTIVDYTFSVADGNGNQTPPGSGTIILADLSTPEPSSAAIVLLTGGTAVLGGLVVRTRRRRKARG